MKKSQVVARNGDDGKALRDSNFAEVSLGNYSEKWGRIQSDPASSARQRLAGSDPPRSSEEQGKADVTIASIERTPDIDQTDKLLELLDQVRDQYESSRLNRRRLMVHARKAGLSCHDIGVALGITESAVRKAIAQAGDLD